MNLLEIKHVTKKFDDKLILNDINLKIKPMVYLVKTELVNQL